MEKCNDCKHWKFDPKNYHDGVDLISVYDSKDHLTAKPGFKFCKNPKLKFYEAPGLDEACLIDGSQYHAALITGKDFGCVNFEKGEE